MGLLTKPNSLRKSADAKLNITSMMDMFTIILVFLLYSYSVEKDPSIEKGLRLPDSNSDRPYRDAITVSLSQEEIKLNDKTVVKLRRGKIPTRYLDQLKVIPLYDELLGEKKLLEANPNKKNPVADTLVLFQADRDAEFAQIDPIMKTAGMAGFPNFRFAVMRRE